VCSVAYMRVSSREALRHPWALQASEHSLLHLYLHILATLVRRPKRLELTMGSEPQIRSYLNWLHRVVDTCWRQWPCK
jgi:hypothetical protein